MLARPTSLDHVALWTDEREALAAFACTHLGMHEIERTDSFTLVGVHAKLGKLTLFDAEGPREPGALECVVLRVPDLGAALSRLPRELDARNGDAALLQAPGGLKIGLVERPGVEYDLDHVVLRLREPDAAAAALGELGFERSDGRMAVADRHLRLEPGGQSEPDRPLLNHLALLVDSAGEVQSEAERRGVVVDDVKDAANTLAVFLLGPEGIRVEYVEHKPGFSLV